MALALPLTLCAQVRTQSPVKFLALGDSYTIGQSVAVRERWPVQLIDSLRARGIDCLDPKIIAATGWRTDNLKPAIEETSLTPPYNLVSLLIGVNNFYQGGSVNSYIPEFEELLDIAIELAGGNKKHVFVLSIPDYGYTTFGMSNQTSISAGINIFNNANRAIAENKDIAYFNITEISRLGLQQPELVASDGLHPSGEMYTRWVNLILQGIVFDEGGVVTEVSKDLNNIKIYPNPSNKTLTIDNLPSSNQRLEMVLRNGNGAMILQTDFIAENGKAQVDITSLQPGNYYYQLFDKRKVLKRGKLVKK